MENRREQISKITAKMHKSRENLKRRSIERERLVMSEPKKCQEIMLQREVMRECSYLRKDLETSRKAEKDNRGKIDILNSKYYVARAKIEVIESEIEHNLVVLKLLTREDSYDRACLREYAREIEAVHDVKKEDIKWKEKTIVTTYCF